MWEENKESEVFHCSYWGEEYWEEGKSRVSRGPLGPDQGQERCDPSETRIEKGLRFCSPNFGPPVSRRKVRKGRPIAGTVNEEGEGNRSPVVSEGAEVPTLTVSIYLRDYGTWLIR